MADTTNGPRWPQLFIWSLAGIGILLNAIGALGLMALRDIKTVGEQNRTEVVALRTEVTTLRGEVGTALYEMRAQESEIAAVKIRMERAIERLDVFRSEKDTPWWALQRDVAELKLQENRRHDAGADYWRDGKAGVP